MLIAPSPTLPYHGWSIQVVPDQDQFAFECFAPGLPDFMNDAEVYESWQDAFDAACQFVDREIALMALTEIANDWLATGLVSDDEYWQLTCFD